MSTAYNKLHKMIETVATALGDDLLKKVAFVGGCSTGLLMSDEFSKEGVRYTDDVDLIINLVGYSNWVTLQEELGKKGFVVSMDDDVNCRMRLGELKVDFMPDDPKILGYSNKWYAKALQTAQDYPLTDQITIRLLTAPFFIATKLEAYNGRGGNDPLSSRDMEDILSLFDGREEVTQEIINSDSDVKFYIAEQIAALMKHQDFDYAVQGSTRGDSGRSDLIFERLEQVAAIAGKN